MRRAHQQLCPGQTSLARLCTIRSLGGIMPSVARLSGCVTEFVPTCSYPLKSLTALLAPLHSTVGAPHHAINRNISDSLHFIVQIGRRPGTRFVSEAFEIRAYDAQN